jgi:hypothetical protein
MSLLSGENLPTVRYRYIGTSTGTYICPGEIFWTEGTRSTATTLHIHIGQSCTGTN